MVNINVSIIDQQVRQLVADRVLSVPGDEDMQRSAAFVLLCTRTLLDLELENALECMTEGRDDSGIDAMYVGPIIEGEFRITLLQGKYKRRLDGKAAFPASEITKMINTVGTLFDPDKPFHAHRGLVERVEEIRSYIRDGYLPHVRVVLCNNGQRWDVDGQTLIDSAGFPEDRVSWEHLNPDRLIGLMQSQATVEAELKLLGKSTVEEFNFRRVLVGKVPVAELASLFERFGDRLLEKNIRRYLGVAQNRVNREIARTLNAPDERSNFYFFNNGITVVCSKFRYNALQGENHIVRLENMQVINGGQTCHTIQRVVRARPDDDWSQVFVLLRLYELEDDQRELIRDITYATNSQNPVDLRDLRANDPVQQRLEMGLRDLDVTYRRKRAIRSNGKSGQIIDPSTAAEAVLAVWRRKPHLARFEKNQHFGRLYGEIFADDLSPAQVIVAVEILRAVEGVRKEQRADAPRFLSYASHFLAMMIGDAVLGDLELSLERLTHRTLEQVRNHLEDFETLYARALLELRILLRLLGVDEDEHSLQKLSATFRRGDLLEELPRLRENSIRRATRMIHGSNEMRRLADELLKDVKNERDAELAIASFKRRLEEYEATHGRMESMDDKLILWVGQAFHGIPELESSNDEPS